MKNKKTVLAVGLVCTFVVTYSLMCIVLPIVKEKVPYVSPDSNDFLPDGDDEEYEEEEQEDEPEDTPPTPTGYDGGGGGSPPQYPPWCHVDRTTVPDGDLPEIRPRLPTESKRVNASDLPSIEPE